ncbi:spore germination protein [Peribacillus sp. SCS-155]|uniref:spore germination protein n=1 Tax=Peribacillus sedimenti TaxID=3115297 RepID=UPI003906C02F
MHFIGPISIGSISGSAIVQFGSTAYISPKTSSKSNTGSGSSNTGALISTHSR